MLVEVHTHRPIGHTSLFLRIYLHDKSKKIIEKETGLYMTLPSLPLMLPDELQDPQHPVIDPIIRNK